MFKCTHTYNSLFKTLVKFNLWSYFEKKIIQIHVQGNKYNVKDMSLKKFNHFHLKKDI